MSATTLQPVEDDVQTLEGLLLKMAWLEYKRFWRELSNHDLTPSQFHTLVAIKENGVGCTMSNLADETNQVSATMTGIVDRLVERGLVERRRNPKDRRRVFVYLTECGKAKLESVYRDKCLKLAEHLETLDKDSRLKLTFSLQQYLQILESTPS